MTSPAADNRTLSKTKKAKPSQLALRAATSPDFGGPAHEYWAGVKAERKASQIWASARCVTVNDFKKDPLFLRVERAVAAILATGKVVTPIDVLIRMKLLRAAEVEDWRFGRIPYLERVVQCNLTKLGKILRILRMHAHDLKLVPSQTAYVRWGKRGHGAPLQFSKTGNPKMEQAYSRHFVWPGKGPFDPPLSKSPTSGNNELPNDSES